MRCLFYKDIMYKLTRIRGNTYTVTVNGTDTGIYRFGRRTAVLIDSGYYENEDFIDFLKKEGIEPAAVIQTHLHIDHIGYNNLLRDEFDCDIYAPEVEIEHELDREYDFPYDIRVNPNEGFIDISGQKFEIVSIPGHSEGHQAVVTPDGVCFLGDALMSEDILNQTKMPYHFEMGRTLKSMAKIREMDYEVYVLSHRGCLTGEELVKAVDANLAKEKDFSRRIRKLNNKKISDDKLAMIFMKEIRISKEKMDLDWVYETAMARVKEYRR